jgi:hypothetical protein
MKDLENIKNKNKRNSKSNMKERRRIVKVKEFGVSVLGRK